MATINAEHGADILNRISPKALQCLWEAAKKRSTDKLRSVPTAARTIILLAFLFPYFKPAIIHHIDFPYLYELFLFFENRRLHYQHCRISPCWEKKHLRPPLLCPLLLHSCHNPFSQWKPFDVDGSVLCSIRSSMLGFCRLSLLGATAPIRNCDHQFHHARLHSCKRFSFSWRYMGTRTILLRQQELGVLVGATFSWLHP